MKNLLWLAALLTLSSGCTLYFGGDDDPCEDYYYGADALEAAGFRNPDTGYCEDWWGGGGGGGCYDGDDYGAADEAAPEAPPDWASCYGYCEGLDEDTCLVTDGCRAAYWDSGLDDADCAPGFCGGNEFLGCWGTAPSGPYMGDSCAGLDAYSCSLYDTCSAHYYDDGSGQRFSYCSDETWSLGCYSDLDCPGGYSCTADEVCGSPPGCGSGGGMGGADAEEPCPDLCYGSCVPDGGGCELIDCAMGYHCELECYDPCDGDDGSFEEPMGGGCDPVCNAGCVPDTWLCEAVDCGPGSHCEEECDPSGACWSTCVPDDTTPACETIFDELACDARADCLPIYTGYGCTCDPDGTCDCMSWEFARCDSAVMPF